MLACNTNRCHSIGRICIGTDKIGALLIENGSADHNANRRKFAFYKLNCFSHSRHGRCHERTEPHKSCTAVSHSFKNTSRFNVFSKVYNFKTVTFKNGFHDIFANIVKIAFNCRCNDCSFVFTVTRTYLLFEKFKNSKIVSGCMTGLKPAVIGLISYAVISIGTTVFFPTAISFTVLKTSAFYVSLAIFITSMVTVLKAKKLSPIYIIVGSAAVGIAAGYIFNIPA